MSSNNENIVVQVENVSKKFTRSIKRSMIYGMKDILRNMCKLPSKTDRLRKDEFWALKDISFEVKKGECLGIIGPNGSGKTTLLSLLNRIYMPDTGKIMTKGKMGALIAVGAGFHPMLTGRENIYINGAILGMHKDEINENFNSIVEFADISDFLDTPVKNYSSGMYVRLGFSIAIHCQQEIQLIDEILSVGDMSFQNKCLRRLAELRENAGAIVFVSHNLRQVRNLCDRILILNNGKQIFLGDTNEALIVYHEIMREKKLMDLKNRKYLHEPLHQTTGEIIFREAGILNESGTRTETIRLGEPITAFYEFETTKDFEELNFSVAIHNESRVNCIWQINTDTDKIRFRNLSKAKYRLIVKFLTPSLVPGLYYPTIAIRNSVTGETYERKYDTKPFIIKGNILPRGIVQTESEWQMKAIDYGESQNSKKDAV